jgi:hypothetical protein
MKKYINNLLVAHLPLLSFYLLKQNEVIDVYVYKNKKIKIVSVMIKKEDNKYIQELEFLCNYSVILQIVYKNTINDCEIINVKNRNKDDNTIINEINTLLFNISDNNESFIDYLTDKIEQSGKFEYLINDVLNDVEIPNKNYKKFKI